MARTHLKVSWKVMAGIMMIAAGIGVACFWWLYYRPAMLQTINQRIPALSAIRDTPRLPDLPDVFPRTAPRVREALRSALTNGRPQL